MNLGMSPQKLNLGFATYGRTQSTSGQYTRESGVLAYFEICQMKSDETFDENYKVPSARVGSEKVHFDNIRSITEKAQWVVNNNIGGAFTWDSSLDDFSGQFCNQGKSPLISTAINILSGAQVPSSTPCNFLLFNHFSFKNIFYYQSFDYSFNFFPNR